MLCVCFCNDVLLYKKYRAKGFVILETYRDVLKVEIKESITYYGIIKFISYMKIPLLLISSFATLCNFLKLLIVYLEYLYVHRYVHLKLNNISSSH